MIRFGHPLPVIDDLDGTAVRTVLAGERPDLGWISWLAEIDPDPRRDLRLLMGLHRLAGQMWTTPTDLAPVLQVTEQESRQVIERLMDHRRDGFPVCHEIDGVPSAAPLPSVALGIEARDGLQELRRNAGTAARIRNRERTALS